MKSVLGLLVLTFSFSAFAQLELGEPNYGGNGCPKGSASVSVTDDRATMSILFDKFSAEAGSTTGRRVDRASCNLRIPVRVMPGYSVSVIHADYRGFAAVPSGGASATFNSEFFFAGSSRGHKMNKKMMGPQADAYQISSDAIAEVWSTCGGDVILAVNASATAISNSAMQQTMIIVDSLDLQNQNLGMTYSLGFRRCQR